MRTGTVLRIDELKNGAPIATFARVSMARDVGDGTKYDEELLQDLLHREPHVLPVADYFPDVRSLVSLGREIPVPVGGGKTRALDNLFITTDGRLVIVEAKLWRNPEALREVVAQALEYARVLTSLPLPALEVQVRRASKDAVLESAETIEGLMARLNDEHALEGYDPTSFGSRLERFLRTGEVLVLIVGDGIHPSVERFVEWFEGYAGLPFRFGMVEIAFHRSSSQGGFIAVPRTLLTTREVSRHVVVVDVRAPEGQLATTTVESREPGLDGQQVARTRRTGQGPSEATTDAELVARTRDESGDTAAQLVEYLNVELSRMGLVAYPTKRAIAWAVEIPGQEDQPLRLVSVDPTHTWAGWFAAPLRQLGIDQAVLRLSREQLNSIAPFWRPEKLDDVHGGLGVRHQDLQGKEQAFLDVVRQIRDALLGAIGT